MVKLIPFLKQIVDQKTGDVLLYSCAILAENHTVSVTVSSRTNIYSCKHALFSGIFCAGEKGVSCQEVKWYRTGRPQNGFR